MTKLTKFHIVHLYTSNNFTLEIVAIATENFAKKIVIEITHKY
jgi:hypothetical protein